MHFQKSNGVKQLSAMIDTEYISIRFMNNESRQWDGKVPDVPSKTVVRMRHCNEEGMEEAKVHWPVLGERKGEVKVWHCAVLPKAVVRTEQEDIRPKAERRPRAEQEDIGPKPAKRPRAEQEDIGPKPAKRPRAEQEDIGPKPAKRPRVEQEDIGQRLRGGQGLSRRTLGRSM